MSDNLLIWGVELLYAKKKGLDFLIKDISNEESINIYDIGDRKDNLKIVSFDKTISGTKQRLLEIIEDRAFALGLEDARLMLVSFNPDNLTEIYPCIQGAKVVKEKNNSLKTDGNSDDEFRISAMPFLLEYIEKNNVNQMQDFTESSEETLPVKQEKPEDIKLENSVEDKPKEKKGLLKKLTSFKKTAKNTVMEDEEDDLSKQEPEDVAKFSAPIGSSNEFSDDVMDEGQNDFNDDISGFTDDIETSGFAHSIETETNEVSIPDDGFTDDIEFKENQEEPKVFEELFSELPSKKDHTENEVTTKSNTSSNQPNADPILLKAIEIFDSQKKDLLPDFDELTHKQMQTEILNAHNAVADARSEVIFEMYQKMKKAIELSAEELDQEVLLPATSKHEKAINTIRKNLEIDIDRIRQESQQKYNDEREKAVQAKLPELRRQFDKENLEGHYKQVNTLINELSNEFNSKIQEENDNYNQYVNDLAETDQENVLQTLDFTELLDKYNNSVKRQKRELDQVANSFNDQLEEAVFQINQEKIELSDKINRLEKELAIQKNSEQQRIAGQVAVELSSLEKEKEIQNEKYYSELKKARKNSELEAKEFKKLLEEEQGKSSELVKRLQELQYEYDIQNNTLLNRESKSGQIYTGKVATGVVNSSENKINKNLLTGLIAMASVLIIVIFLAVSMFSYNAGSKTANTSPVEVSTEPSKSNVSVVEQSKSNSESSNGLQNVKKFPYTTEKGEKVEIIVDTPNTGHYVDSDGKTHYVTF